MTTTTKAAHTAGRIEIKRGPIKAVFVLDGRPIATARIFGKTWALSIPGHQWAVTPDMPSARFNKIPGDKITRVSVKVFPSKSAALAEVKAIRAAAEARANG